MVVLLASRRPGESMTKTEIAIAEGISPGYVQQLMMALRLAGIVESHRGREGGFSLSRSVTEVTVADVLRAVEGEIMPAPCQGGVECDRFDDCPTRPVWEEAADMLNEFFSRTTIASLTDDRRLSAVIG
jgi:Rrf2 family cysteine metabolism transcriptional repressor